MNAEDTDIPGTFQNMLWKALKLHLPNKGLKTKIEGPQHFRDTGCSGNIWLGVSLLYSNFREKVRFNKKEAVSVRGARKAKYQRITGSIFFLLSNKQT